MSENKFTVADEMDPNRCQGIKNGDKGGQCVYLAVPNSQYCIMHGGHNQQTLNKKAALAGYRLGQYQERMMEFASDPDIKSLRQEIGIIRMTLENVVVQCENANKLLIYSEKISNLVGQVQRLMVTCQALEEKNNNLLDRKIVIVIADTIVTLMGDYITDPDQLNEIGTRICESITSAAAPALAVV